MPIAIPTFEKDRGTFDQNNATGSTRQHAVKDTRSAAYVDATGACGCDSYKSISASLSIYDNINCVRRLVAAGSLSVQLRSDEYTQAGFTTIATALADYIRPQLPLAIIPSGATGG